MANIDLIQLYQRIFGPIGTPYLSAKPGNYLPFSSAFEKPEELPTFSSDESSLLGVRLFMPVKLDGLQLPNEPIVQVGFRKQVIKTPIDGNDGTFKQIYCNNDYDVIIRGIAVNEEADDYPEDFMRQLRKIAEKRSSVSVACRLLSIYGIDLLTIEAVNTPAVEGFQNIQPYEIMCVSDKDYPLQLRNPKR